jgi:putative nucleotidyltransferase with HDIG domain
MRSLMPAYVLSLVFSVAVIMAIEALIMVQLGPFLARLPEFQAAILDAMLLGVGASPVLWLLVGKPLAQAMAGDAAREASRQSHAARLSAEQEKEAALERLKRTLDQSVGALAQMIDKRDPYTAGHQARVAKIAESIARTLNLSEDEVENIRLGALMHDIGKIAVPSEILTKPGQLIPEEMALVRTHPKMGGEIVGHIDFDPAILRIVTQHHERLDGSGYPYGLKGDEIAFEARIVAVADVLEAITSHRPYRPALGLDKAIAELQCQRGTTLDARVVDACLELLDNATPLEGLPGIVPLPKVQVHG